MAGMKLIVGGNAALAETATAVRTDSGEMLASAAGQPAVTKNTSGTAARAEEQLRHKEDHKPTALRDILKAETAVVTTNKSNVPLEELGRRRQRRAKRNRDIVDHQNWELRKMLADVTTELEAVAKEAGRIRFYWSAPGSLVNNVDLPEDERNKLEASHQRRTAELLAKQCATTVKQVMGHKWAWPFNQPVDVSQYPDYTTVIQQPMDLGTIKNKIETKQYKHPEECYTDVRLVFANAKRYNPPGTDVYIMAHTVEERFEEKWQSLVLPKLTDEVSIKAQEQHAFKKKLVESQQQQVLDQLDDQRLLLMRQVDELLHSCTQIKSNAAAACQAMTHTEKDKLTRALALLPQNHFDTAMSLVLAHHPHMLPCHEGETILNVDTLDALTLRMMQSFIDAVERSERRAMHVHKVGPSSRRDDGEVEWPGLVVGAGVSPFHNVSSQQHPLSEAGTMEHGVYSSAVSQHDKAPLAADNATSARQQGADEEVGTVSSGPNAAVVEASQPSDVKVHNAA